MAAAWDVAVLGGGPAGLAVAAALARQGRSVAVLERGPHLLAKAGETFGPRLRPLLEELGAWEEFLTVARLPHRGVRAAWGAAEIHDQPSLLHPLGEGWHVDRARFEEMLAAVAVRAGAELRTGLGRCGARRTERGFSVHAEDSEEILRARYLVDASGRGAPATARMLPERRWLSLDRQVALPLRAPLHEAVGPELLLESCEEGWWYSVPLPDGTLLCALLTDADLLPPGPGRSQLGAGLEVLSRTLHSSRLARSAGTFQGAAVVRADAGFLVPDRGPGWRAVGDAGMGGDPLAGNGLEQALEGALKGASAIGRELDGAPPEPPSSPFPRIEAYLETRARYYGRERRWRSAPYWRRRHAVDVGQAPLWLEPTQVLVCGQDQDAATRARAEALVPRGALRKAQEMARQPHPAHVVLAALRAAAPMDDRRLLVALQLLVEDGGMSLPAARSAT